MPAESLWSKSRKRDRQARSDVLTMLQAASAATATVVAACGRSQRRELIGRRRRNDTDSEVIYSKAAPALQRRGLFFRVVATASGFGSMCTRPLQASAVSPASVLEASKLAATVESLMAGIGKYARSRLRQQDIDDWKALSGSIGSVLELGGGRGYWSQRLATLAKDINWKVDVVCGETDQPGWDPTTALFLPAMRRVPINNSDRTSLGSATEMTLKDFAGSNPKSFDLIVMRNGMCNCNKGKPTCGGLTPTGAQQFSDEVRALLRPGGAAVFTQSYRNRIHQPWLEAFSTSLGQERANLAVSSPEVEFCTEQTLPKVCEAKELPYVVYTA